MQIVVFYFTQSVRKVLVIFLSLVSQKYWLEIFSNPS